jgi:5-(carboxyamino)imidazole ribonucleotide synthase
MTQPILPGSTLGVLGGGQLGRMFAIAARRLGYRVHVLSPDDDTPTGQVADLEIPADYDDVDTVERFARGVSVVTFEFENVPAAATEAAGRHAPVRPGGHVLHVVQNRNREKGFLQQAGLPVTPFAPVHTAADLEAAVKKLGTPGVLKTASFGYDGKGQVKVATPADAMKAWESLGRVEAHYETFIDFACEVSIVAVRGLDGSFAYYGPIHNTHANHILDISVLPAPIAERTARDAVDIARQVMAKLDVVGVLCVEYFVKHDGSVMVNELAPRPHNSGHLTIDGCVTCQFEQQVRAICGLPLGDTRAFGPTAMANLLGDVWQGGEPKWSDALKDGDVKLHLYGKSQAKAGRKMGHLNAVADTADAAIARVRAARDALR